MSVTKTSRTLQSSASNAAGGTATGSPLDLTSALGGTLTAKVTNGATGPTIACSLYIELSADNSNWKLFRQYVALLGNNIVTEFAVEIPASVMYLRTRFSGNTGQGVTVEAFLHELTSL